MLSSRLRKNEPQRLIGYNQEKLAYNIKTSRGIPDDPRMLLGSFTRETGEMVV